MTFCIQNVEMIFKNEYNPLKLINIAINLKVEGLRIKRRGKIENETTCKQAKPSFVRPLCGRYTGGRLYITRAIGCRDVAKAAGLPLVLRSMSREKSQCTIQVIMRKRKSKQIIISVQYTLKIIKYFKINKIVLKQIKMFYKNITY